MKAAKLGNEEVTYLDRISHLPDDLLFRILSLVPVRISMSTSLLSKRWNSVWKTMPSLVYEETCPYNGSLGFDQFSGMSLRLHEAPVLKTLDLKLRNPSDFIDTLFFPNIRSTLLELAITVTLYPHYSPIRFPNNLDVFKTLVVLKLQDRIVLDVVDSPVCFPSLKSLHLACVKFQCEDSLPTLLSACPVLEDLFLQRLCSVGRFFYTISSPSLQRLFITTELAYYHYNDPTLEINTPSLEYLKIFDRRGLFEFDECIMPKLVEANVSVHLPKNGKLLEVLSTSVEHLSIDLYPSKVLHLTDRFIFNRLLHLELGTCYNFRPSLLLHWLKDCPTLRALKINHRYWINAVIVEQPCFFSEPSSVPECLSFHLETLQWICYGGTLRENGFAVYILKNSPCLKTATISLHSTGMENDLMVKELKSMSKASTSCRLVIEF